MKNTTKHRIPLSEGNYATINNAVLFDSRITGNAFKLLVWGLNNMEDWYTKTSFIGHQLGWSKEILAKATSNLIECGYMEKVKKSDGNGRFSYQYTFYEMPKSTVTTGGPSRGGLSTPGESRGGEPRAGITRGGEPTLINNTNTDNTNKNKTNKKISNQSSNQNYNSKKKNNLDCSSTEIELEESRVEIAAETGHCSAEVGFVGSDDLIDDFFYLKGEKEKGILSSEVTLKTDSNGTLSNDVIEDNYLLDREEEVMPSSEETNESEQLSNHSTEEDYYSNEETMSEQEFFEGTVELGEEYSEITSTTEIEIDGQNIASVESKEEKVDIPSKREKVPSSDKKEGSGSIDEGLTGRAFEYGGKAYYEFDISDLNGKRLSTEDEYGKVTDFIAFNFWFRSDEFESIDNMFANMNSYLKKIKDVGYTHKGQPINNWVSFVNNAISYLIESPVSKPKVQKKTKQEHSQSNYTYQEKQEIRSTNEFVNQLYDSAIEFANEENRKSWKEVGIRGMQEIYSILQSWNKDKADGIILPFVNKSYCPYTLKWQAEELLRSEMTRGTDYLKRNTQSKMDDDDLPF